MRPGIVLAALIALIGPAHAGLSVCNNSTHTLRVALGLFNGAHWASQGWWFVPPKNCAKLVPEPLAARYYYLYATNENFGLWDGNKNFCVTVFMKFSIVSRAACEARGYYHLGFFEIDTGNHLDWTQTIADPG